MSLLNMNLYSESDCIWWPGSLISSCDLMMYRALIWVWNRIEKFESLRRKMRRTELGMTRDGLNLPLSGLRSGFQSWWWEGAESLQDVFIKATWGYGPKHYCIRSKWTVLSNFAVGRQLWAQRSNLGTFSQRTQVIGCGDWLMKNINHFSWIQVTHPDILEINTGDFDRKLKKSFSIKDRA